MTQAWAPQPEPEAQPDAEAQPGVEQPSEAEAPPSPGPTVHSLATPLGAGDGVNRCSKCGASEVSYSDETMSFTCGFCRFNWTEGTLDERMKLSEGIAELKGTTVSTAAGQIEDDGAIVTLKCTGCGAEVMIDTDKNLNAKCHWCQHVLSLNNKQPNGAVPDGLLPFTLSKEQAMANIRAFVEKRKTFAQDGFLTTFVPENVRGVYLPYMTVDGNLTVRLDGIGEVGTGSYQVGKNQRVYRANRFKVIREMEIIVDDLIVETSEDKVNIHSEMSTNNIINAILPFDVKHMVRFNSSFLGDAYTSERRDMDIAEAESYAADHYKTISRGWVQSRIQAYDRGVRWESEQVRVKGSRWVAVLLPVWLYSFVENRKGVLITHYIAVNGRTGATMGSVPIKKSKAALAAWGTAVGVSAVTWPLAILALATG